MTDTGDRGPASLWAKRLGVAAAFGVVGALAALAFVGLTAAGQALLWPDDPEPQAFSGSPWTIVILTGAGLLAGLYHRHNERAGEVNVFVALAEGRIDARAVPGGLVLALISLIGGFSLGPEVPTGMAAAGLATYVARRGNLSSASSAAGVTAGISGAWAGLFTAPLTVTLFGTELSFGKQVVGWTRLAGDAVAAFVGFSLFFAIDAGWSSAISLLPLEPYDLELWHLGVAVLLGVLGAVVATFFKLSMVLTRRLAVPFEDYPVLRGAVAGLVLGLLGFALPLTLFLGTDGLVDVTTDPGAIGIGLILLTVVAKVFATTGALSFGFVGGPIFPLLFAGGAIGSAVSLAIPDLPPALTVTAMMAAVPSAVVPVPLSIATLVLLVGGLDATDATPVFTAAIVSLVVGQLIELSLKRRLPAPHEDPA